jgi:glycerol-3-phosphate dehydrogenase
MRSASQLGCDAFENAKFLNAEKNSDGTFTALSHIDGRDQHFQCKLIVNAAGPWVDQVQQKINSAPRGPQMELIQGTHIEFDAPLTEDIFYVESPDDKRAVFIMPWQGKVLVGTTEKQHLGDPASAKPSNTEIAYLKRTLQHYFPLYTGSYTRAWCGLRVLPLANFNKNLRPFSARARDTVVLTDSPKTPTAISLYGGKLTAYRVTADKVAKMAEKTLGVHEHPQDTAQISLS